MTLVTWRGACARPYIGVLSGALLPMSRDLGLSAAEQEVAVGRGRTPSSTLFECPLVILSFAFVSR